MEKLGEVYNRGFSSGFYLGMPTSDDWSHNEGNVSSMRKVDVGKVVNYYAKNNVAAVNVTAHGIKIGDKLIVMGNKTGVVEVVIREMEVEHKKTDKIEKGLAGIKTDKVLRTGDKVFLWE